MTSQPSIADENRDKLLSEPGVYGSFVALKVDKTWWLQTTENRATSLDSLSKVFETQTHGVAIDLYLLRGLTENVDFLIRVHSRNLLDNQKFILKVMNSRLGAYLDNVVTINGLTKSAIYLPSFLPELKKIMSQPSDPGPSRNPYVIVIPSLKDPTWWLAEKTDRTEMMREHTAATVEALPKVKRKLYHSTGLGEYDFIAYFETSRLDVFNELVIGLKKVTENRHNEKTTPVLLGTVISEKELLEFLK
jgi:chlorite dismutase